jgi:type I restriction enzyme S subunit
VSLAWQAKALAEICQIKPPKGEARERLGAADLVSFVPMEDLGIGQKFVEPKAERKLGQVAGSYTYFADGDVLLAKITPCFENGKLGIARGLTNGIGFGSSEYFVFRPNDGLSSEYLYYFLSQDSFRAKGERTMSGAVGHKRVSKEFIERCQIPLPPLSEQQRIVAILDEVLAGLATATANAENSLSKVRELFDSYLNLIFQNSRGGWTEWRLGDERLLEIIDGDRGAKYPKKTDFSSQGYCIFLNTKNVRPDGFDFEETMYITEKKDRELRKGRLKRSDVVLTTRGTIGNIAVYDQTVPFENIRINSGMLILRPQTQKLLPKYLFEVCRSAIVKSQVTRHVSGAAQPQLPIKTLVQFSIPVPDTLAEQQRIVDNLADLSVETSQLEAAYERKLLSLAELKQSILQKAFSGDLTAPSSQAIQQAAE